jgi:hypothetical protein
MNCCDDRAAWGFEVNRTGDLRSGRRSDNRAAAEIAQARRLTFVCCRGCRSGTGPPAVTFSRQHSVQSRDGSVFSDLNSLLACD